MVSKKRYSFIAPAGRYYIGDPCYSIADNHWGQWLTNAGLDNEDDTNMLTGTIVDSFDAYAFNTAHGDGTYLDQNGREYDVDAGLIGLVPLSYLEANNVEIEKDWTFVTFDRPTECISFSGILCFGNITIRTDYDEEEEEEVDEDEEDWADYDEE
jgi:hypothetical protein